MQRAQLAVGPDDAVLDVGCGAGWIVTELVRQRGDVREIMACDASAAACAAAARRFVDHRLAVDLRSGDVRSLPFEDARATVAIACGVLEHVPDAAVAVTELRRVIRPGGQLMIVTSHTRSLVYLERRIRERTGTWPYGYQKNHTLASLGSLVEPHFQIVTAGVAHTAWDFPLAALADRSAGKIVPQWGRYLYARCERT